jgi:hypothetical protein
MENGCSVSNINIEEKYDSLIITKEFHYNWYWKKLTSILATRLNGWSLNNKILLRFQVQFVKKNT